MNTTPETITRLCALGCAALSDALDSLGVDGGLPGISARVPGVMAVGPAFTVTYRPLAKPSGRFQQAGTYIDDVPAGAFVVIDNEGRDDATVWGNILTEVALRNDLAGTLIHGAARDLKRIRELRFPLYSRHVFMQSAKNRAAVVARQEPVTITGRTINPGDIVCADDDGCLILPAHLVEEVCQRAEATERTEARILTAVRAGMPLAEARQLFGYATPWAEVQK